MAKKSKLKKNNQDKSLLGKSAIFTRKGAI